MQFTLLWIYCIVKNELLECCNLYGQYARKNLSTLDTKILVNLNEFS